MWTAIPARSYRGVKLHLYARRRRKQAVNARSMHALWQVRYTANGPISLMWSCFLARMAHNTSHLGDEEIWAASVHLGCTQMTIRGHVVVARV